MKELDFRKNFKKRIIKFGFSMIEKYYIQVLILD